MYFFGFFLCFFLRERERESVWRSFLISIFFLLSYYVEQLMLPLLLSFSGCKDPIRTWWIDFGEGEISFFSLLPLSHCWRWLEFNQVCSCCISLGALGVEFHFSLTGEWCQMLCSSRPIQIFRWLKLKLRHSRGYNAMISSMWWDTLAESWNGQQ